METLRLNPRLDAAALAGSFAGSGRLQVEDFLEPADAQALVAAIQALDYNVVLNSGARHVDMSSQQVTAMGQARFAAVIEEVHKSASIGFQYLYENYPLSDLAEAGRLADPLARAILALMNAAPTLAFLREVTDLAADFCDMQATRYGRGDFLTIHDDNAAGKNRTFAYVLGLTEGWSPTWGGQLQFLDSKTGGVLETFAPKFNALSLLAVPQLHHVSQVSTFAAKDRLSLTGWYRMRG